MMPRDEMRELAAIGTISELETHLGDDAQCLRCLEAIVWMSGRVCPHCGGRRSVVASTGESSGILRPGIYQCANPTCKRLFSATTGTPLHTTKLPLRTWLTGLWLMLRSDNTISTARFGEVLSVSRPTALRMKHVLQALCLPASAPQAGETLRNYRSS